MKGVLRRDLVRAVNDCFALGSAFGFPSYLISQIVADYAERSAQELYPDNSSSRFAAAMNTIPCLDAGDALKSVLRNYLRPVYPWVEMIQINSRKALSSMLCSESFGPDDRDRVRAALSGRKALSTGFCSESFGPAPIYERDRMLSALWGSSVSLAEVTPGAGGGGAEVRLLFSNGCQVCGTLHKLTTISPPIWEDGRPYTGLVSRLEEEPSADDLFRLSVLPCFIASRYGRHLLLMQKNTIATLELDFATLLLETPPNRDLAIPPPNLF